MAIKELAEAMYFVSSLQFWRMAVLWTASLMFSYFLLVKRRFLSSNCSYSHSLYPPTTAARPVCIITGATSGLGLATAFALSREGFYVLLAGRRNDVLFKTVKEIKKQNMNAHLEAFEVDMSSFQSIIKFKIRVQEWLSDSNMDPSIQLLVNNAGILATSNRVTAEGYDQMLATNYIGAFCLTKLLLPLLKNSPTPSRIVNITSFTHRNVFDVKFCKEAFSGKYHSSRKRYPYSQVYEYSKLCVLLFSYELHRQLQLMEEPNWVSVVAVDPGVVKTNILREVPSCLSLLAFTALKVLGVLQSPETAADSIVNAALAPPEASGAYFFGANGRTIDSSAVSRNQKLAAELWRISCDIFSELQLASRETLPLR